MGGSGGGEALREKEDDEMEEEGGKRRKRVGRGGMEGGQIGEEEEGRWKSSEMETKSTSS